MHCGRIRNIGDAFYISVDSAFRILVTDAACERAKEFQ